MIVIKQVNFIGESGFEIIFSDGGYARVEQVIDNTLGVLRKEEKFLLNSTLLSFESFSGGGFYMTYETIDKENRFLQVKGVIDKEMEETKELSNEWRLLNNERISNKSAGKT